nr:intersectin-1-like [Monopterus albus]
MKIDEVRRAKLIREEEQRRAAQKGLQKRATLEELQRRVALEEQQRRAAPEEQQRRAAPEEEQRRAALEEQQRRAALEEQQRRAAPEEQQRRAAPEEEQRKAALEEQQRRAVPEEEQRRAALEEQQRRAALEEQQRRAAPEEQQRRAAPEEEQRKAALEEQQRRAVPEEEQRRAALEEQQRRAALEEQQRRAAPEEQQRRAAQKEQQRRAALEEQQGRAAQEEQERRAAQEEQQRRAALKEQQMRTALEEEQRRAALEEEQRRAAPEEQQRSSKGELQQRRAALEEEQRRAAQEEQQGELQLIEEQKLADQVEEKTLTDFEKEKKRKQREEEAAEISGEEIIKQIQEEKKAEQQTEQQRRERQKIQEWMRTLREEEEERKAIEIEKTIIKQKEENQAKGQKTRFPEVSYTAVKEEEKRVAGKQMLTQREDEISAKEREEGKSAAHRDKERAPQRDEQKKVAQRMAALQYYAITSTESESKPEERQLCSPLLPQQRNNPSELESAEDTGPHPRPYRPHAPASPVPSLPRSNTASPALGPKPSMFRVKDNTTRGYSFTKSVKPRFHKNLGEDFHAGLTMDRQLERGDEEQEIMRPSTVTSAHPDIEINRLDTVKESLTFQPVSSSQGYPAPLPQHRPYFRRSIALDDDDSRSVISTMSEDVESFASSAAHLSDVRCMYDYKRPESACSFSSDMSRSLGKPPTVPPKSDKALRRAKRLSSRRINRELSKAVADNTAGVKKSPQEVSNIPSTSSTEVRFFTRHAVASPHISALVSLAHAPALGSSLPSHTEHQSSNHSIHAPSYATCPISLPASLPHANAPASHIAAPKTVAHVASSPTLQHANHPAPVTQYHVESSYPQPYPLTQRKVLQDPGSGQYFVVDMPVQVKKKTFFDPETGNYVQLNVRESSQSTSCPQLQQTYSQPQLQPQIQAMLHQHPLSRASPAGKPFVLYQGYDGCPQGHQPINSVAPHRSSGPVALHQDQQPVRENHSYGYSAPQMGQNSEGSCYSPEKTPYMDTVNETDKTYSTVYNTHGSYESFPECDTNSQLAGSSVCENDNSAHSRYQPRDIIAMSELEDFMEVSDW